MKTTNIYNRSLISHIKTAIRKNERLSITADADFIYMINETLMLKVTKAWYNLILKPIFLRDYPQDGMVYNFSNHEFLSDEIINLWKRSESNAVNEAYITPYIKFCKELEINIIKSNNEVITVNRIYIDMIDTKQFVINARNKTSALIFKNREETFNILMLPIRVELSEDEISFFSN